MPGPRDAYTARACSAIADDLADLLLGFREQQPFRTAADGSAPVRPRRVRARAVRSRDRRSPAHTDLRVSFSANSVADIESSVCVAKYHSTRRFKPVRKS